MNFPAILFLFRWLVRETFRQALAARTFWLMLTVSGLCIIFCLGVSVDGIKSLHKPGEIELIDDNNKPLTGPNPNAGHWSMAFGLVRLDLCRDAETQVHFLETFLAFWIAGGIGTLVTLIWTAGFLPGFLEPSAASVLLAKPVPRWVLLFGKFVGVLAFVAFQEIVFFVGTWLALGLRTGIWSPQYLVCIPLFMLHFTTIYSFSALMAVCTRSTVAAIFGSLLFWLCCYTMNFARHAVVALPYLEVKAPFSPALQSLAEVGYWLLPKPADMVILLNDGLQAGNHFDLLPNIFRIMMAHGAFLPELSLLTSLLGALVLLATAARRFITTDY
jgi:ABC-type transport system involved in multi-copper enzyme maturation permease subunit